MLCCVGVKACARKRYSAVGCKGMSCASKSRVGLLVFSGSGTSGCVSWEESWDSMESFIALDYSLWTIISKNFLRWRPAQFKLQHNSTPCQKQKVQQNKMCTLCAATQRLCVGLRVNCAALRTHKHAHILLFEKRRQNTCVRKSLNATIVVSLSTQWIMLQRGKFPRHSAYKGCNSSLMRWST